MDEVKILLWAVTGLVALLGLMTTVLGFFIRSWINKLEHSISLKLDTALCDERHPKTNQKCDTLFKHKHAPSYPDGRGGEVIIP